MEVWRNFTGIHDFESPRPHKVEACKEEVGPLGTKSSGRRAVQLDAPTLSGCCASAAQVLQVLALARNL